MRSLRLWLPLSVLVLVVACSANGTGRPLDAGGSGRTDGGGVPPGVDGGGVPPGTDGGPLPEWDGGPDAGCESTTPLDAEIIGDPPDVLIVMDISGSMCTPLLGGGFPTGMDTKMRIMKTALTSLVTSKDARINFGLMTFPSDGACGAGNIRNGVAPRNATPINTTIGGIRDDLFGCATMNPGATPTAPSIDAARSYFGTIPVNPIGRYVILATDGLPNCGPEQPDGSTAETVDETVTAIGALHAAGIDTYVIGFGTDLTGGAAALNRMATAGGTGTPFNASSAAELDAALDAIAAAVIPPSCTVELGGPMRDPALFQVRLDGGALVPRNMSHTSGWDYDPATNTITFYGSDCDRISRGEVASIDVDFGCPGPLI